MILGNKCTSLMTQSQLVKSLHITRAKLSTPSLSSRSDSKYDKTTNPNQAFRIRI